MGLGFREGGLQHEAEGVAALTAQPAASLQPSFRGKYGSWKAVLRYFEGVQIRLFDLKKHCIKE